MMFLAAMTSAFEGDRLLRINCGTLHRNPKEKKDNGTAILKSSLRRFLGLRLPTIGSTGA
jgi:hypothetical protein